MTRRSKHNYTSLLDVISGNQRKYYVVRNGYGCYDYSIPNGKALLVASESAKM